MPATPTCNICVSPFTAKVRKEVACPYCQHAACLDCIKKYLLSRPEDPHCMSCKRAWNREFLDSHLSMAFRKGELRTHREDVLLDREKARIPLLQPRIEARTAAQECNQKISDLDVKIRALDMKITAIHNEQANFIRKRSRFMRIVDGLAPADAAVDEEKTRKQFVQKCTAEDCRGFLSSAWKCGVCATWVCPDCLVPKGKEKDTPHTCNEDTKETVRLIKKETKPCPKCGMAITKVDGCDQMWCTVCQTPFSWKTGQQVFGVVHNPHYYVWLRAQNGGEAPRVPGDIPCGGLVYFQTLSRTLAKSLHKVKYTRICEAIHRVATEIYDMLPGYPRPDQVPDNGDLGVQYAFKDIDETQWKSRLVGRETAREKGLELRGVLDLFVNVCSEALRRIAEPATPAEEIGTLIGQIYELRTYVNQAFTVIGVRYGGMTPKISDGWRVDLYGSNRKGNKSQIEKREITLLLDRSKLTAGQNKILNEEILPHSFPMEFGKEGQGARYVLGEDGGRYYGGVYRSEQVKGVLKILEIRTADEVAMDTAMEAAQKVLKGRAAPPPAQPTQPAAGGGAPIAATVEHPGRAASPATEAAIAALIANDLEEATRARRAAAEGAAGPQPAAGGGAPATDAAIGALLATDPEEAIRARRAARQPKPAP